MRHSELITLQSLLFLNKNKIITTILKILLFFALCILLIFPAYTNLPRSVPQLGTFVLFRRTTVYSIHLLLTNLDLPTASAVANNNVWNGATSTSFGANTDQDLLITSGMTLSMFFFSKPQFYHL